MTIQEEPTDIKTFTGLQREAHLRAVESGWWIEYHAGDATLRKHFIAGKIALVHSEVSEALEGFRKNKMDEHLPHRKSIEVEFGDAIIRMFDLADELGLDLEGAIIEKMAYNSIRPDHKLEHRAAEGGKSL